MNFCCIASWKALRVFLDGGRALQLDHRLLDVGVDVSHHANSTSPPSILVLALAGARCCQQPHSEHGGRNATATRRRPHRDLRRSGQPPQGVLWPRPDPGQILFQDDLVVCVLRGGFTRVEETLLEGGRGAAVIGQRMEFQELMRDRFEAVVEEATGCRVIGFMSGNQQDPDMMCEVFILAPTDLVR
jgi:uncharacterized protein YbcI